MPTGRVRAATFRSRTCAAPGRPARGPAHLLALPAPLTCSRVARERTAPGAARAPELAAVAQLFLLVLPPPALSHRRGAEAQPRDGGRAPGAPRPAPSGPGRRPRGRSGGGAAPGAADSAASADSTCSRPGRGWRGPSRFPRLLLAAHRGLLLPAFSLPLASPFRFPFPAPRTWSQGSGGFWPGLASSGRGFGPLRPPHSPTLWNHPLLQNKPVQKKKKKLARKGFGKRWPGLFLPFHSTFRCQQETHLLDT